MSEMVRICNVCWKEFNHAPYYIRVGGTFKPVCSVQCLHNAGEQVDGE